MLVDGTLSVRLKEMAKGTEEVSCDKKKVPLFIRIGGKSDRWM